MRRNGLNLALSWLCLIWFGLTSTLLNGGLVVCSDGDGGARIEWGCVRGADGECATSCRADAGESDDRDNRPEPCRDTPIQGDLQIAKAPPRTTNDAPVLAPVIFAVVAMLMDVPPPAQIAWDRVRPQRPPDTLQRLRSVILVV